MPAGKCALVLPHSVVVRCLLLYCKYKLILAGRHAVARSQCRCSVLAASFVLGHKDITRPYAPRTAVVHSYSPIRRQRQAVHPVGAAGTNNANKDYFSCACTCTTAPVRDKYSIRCSALPGGGFDRCCSQCCCALFPLAAGQPSRVSYI